MRLRRLSSLENQLINARSSASASAYQSNNDCYHGQEDNERFCFCWKKVRRETSTWKYLCGECRQNKFSFKVIFIFIWVYIRFHVFVFSLTFELIFMLIITLIFTLEIFLWRIHSEQVNFPSKRYSILNPSIKSVSSKIGNAAKNLNPNPIC